MVLMAPSRPVATAEARGRCMRVRGARRSARGRAAMRKLDMLACMAREARGGPDRKEYLGTHVRLALVKSRSSVVEMVFRF